MQNHILQLLLQHGFIVEESGKYYYNLKRLFSVIISAVERLIAINHILITSKIKVVCLHNICMCTVYIYYVYIYIQTHACIYLRKICYVYKLNIFLYDIYIHINDIYMQINVKIKKIYAVFVSLYIHNKYTQYTHTL